MSESKDTNPKDAVGTAKAPLSTIPTEVITELGLVMMEGALKYGRHNYRVAGVRASVYVDAMWRHLVRFWEGEDLDPDSGMPHLVHIMACAAVLRDSQFMGNWNDDRPPALPKDWLANMNDKARAMLDKYQNPIAAHTALDEQPVASVVPRVVSMLTKDCRDAKWTNRFGWTYVWSESAGRWTRSKPDRVSETITALYPSLQAPYTEVLD